MAEELEPNCSENNTGLVLLFNRFIKFTGVGVIGTTAHYLILILFVHFFQLDSVIASSFGAIAGALINYFLNFYYTFNSSKKHHVAISQFFVIAGISFILNGLLMTILTEKLTLHYLLAQILTTVILLIWNFLGNQFWTFRESQLQKLKNATPDFNYSAMDIYSAASIVPEWRSDKLFIYIIIFSAIYLFWGVWWGWPSSLDQHDPTPFAIKMLWHHTLDPGRRYYGSFGYQEVLLLSVIPITILKKLLSLDPGFSESLMFLVTRILWAFKAMATVGLTYWVSLELFHNRRAALIAMLMLVLSPGFIAWSHTPQLDTVHAFWYSLAVAFTAAGWNRSSIKLLWFASVFAGFTASIKYLGGVIVLAPMIAVFLNFPYRAALKYATLFMITALSIFFITTPLATGSPISWLPEFTADVLYNQRRETENPLAFWTMPGTIKDMIGPGTSVLAFVALFIFLFTGKSSTKIYKQQIVVFTSCFIPYYLLLSWQHVATIRYLLPLGPILLVAVGLLLSKGLENRKVYIPLLTLVIPAGAIQLALTTALVIGFATDTRMAMASWLEAHTEPHDQVETILNHRPFFAGKPSFQVINRPHFQAESYDMKRLVDADTDSPVRKLHNVFIKLAEKKPDQIVTWVDKERAWLAKSAETFDTSIQGPVNRQSKYIALNVNTAMHYIVNWKGVDPLSPHEKDFIQALLNEEEPFKQVAEFSPVIPKWLRYPEELWFNLSPIIKIYEVKYPKHIPTPSDKLIGEMS